MNDLDKIKYLENKLEKIGIFFPRICKFEFVADNLYNSVNRGLPYYKCFDMEKNLIFWLTKEAYDKLGSDGE